MILDASPSHFTPITEWLHGNSARCVEYAALLRKSRSTEIQNNLMTQHAPKRWRTMYNNLATIGTLLVMQVAYWYRLLRVPIPFESSNVILNHLLLFLGRLSFIFGGALFSLVFFRHLPELDRSADVPLLLGRGLLLGYGLFALFCVTLELERLGHALGNDRRN
jgi:hypothetical protein